MRDVRCQESWASRSHELLDCILRIDDLLCPVEDRETTMTLFWVGPALSPPHAFRMDSFDNEAV